MIGKKFRPPVTRIGETKSFSLYGKSFFNITGVYLSGYVFDKELTFFDPFSASTKLSAQYPGFEAIQLSASEYSYNRDNTLLFTMPSAAYEGYVDVILSNDAGWGALTQFVIKDFENPFLTGSDLFNNYESYQRPWKRGVIVGAPALTSLSTFTSGLSVSFTLHPSADSDFDGFTDEVELIAGTDVNDLSSFPVSLFNVFNNI